MTESETIKKFTTQTLQSGAALVVGLIMLVVIAVLATSSTQTAVSGLLIARNHQTHELAFQAAETGLELILAATSFDTGRSVSSTRDLDARTSVNMKVEFVGQTGVPDEIPGIDDEGGLVAYHFVGTATATVQRNSGADSRYDVSTVHSQSFYVVVPGPALASAPTIVFPDSSLPRDCAGSDCLDTGVHRSLVRTVWRVEGIH